MTSSSLQNVYLFKTLTPDEMKQVDALATVESHSAGETIFIRGEPAKALYLIKFGSIKIRQTTKSGDTMDVATLGTGSHFGEMPFLDGEPRSATAEANEAVELITLPYDKLQGVMENNQTIAMKIYREMAHFMCGRLRATTNDLGFAREKNLSHF
jgi:CRP-like cAMP-binding protein